MPWMEVKQNQSYSAGSSSRSVKNPDIFLGRGAPAPATGARMLFGVPVPNVLKVTPRILNVFNGLAFGSWDITH